MDIQAGERYRHYKGKEYTILAVARNESDPEEFLVIYRAEYDSPDFGNGCVWARPLELFNGNLDVDGKELKRFTRIE